MTILQIISVALRIACALAAWLFVFTYARVRWTGSDVGRLLMGLTLIVAVFMTLASITSTLGRFPGFDYVAVGLYGYLLYLLLRLRALLNRAQREHD